jgi:hypothetical protein
MCALNSVQRLAFSLRGTPVIFHEETWAYLFIIRRPTCFRNTLRVYKCNIKLSGNRFTFEYFVR